MSNKRMIVTAVLASVAFWFGDLYGAEYFPQELEMPARIKRGDLTFYSEILDAMKEPPLWSKAKDPNAKSYRFLYIRQKGLPEPVVLRLEAITKTNWTLTVKEADYSSLEWRLEENREKPIAEEEVNQFQRLFTQLEFWELPTVGALEAEDEQVDGTHWILEAVENGRYHLVRRRTPKDAEGLWVSYPEFAEAFEKLRREEGFPYIDRATSMEVNRKLVALGEFLVKLSGLRLDVH